MKPTVHILIVEDDPALNDAYTTILESVPHYRVGRTYNGSEALEYIQRQGDPDVILLDLRMPVMDGIHFLRSYRPAEHSATAVIVFSNYDAHKDIEEAHGLGVARYVLKARVAPKDLLHLIDQVAASPGRHTGDSL